ncbi:MAG: hypothetical protein JWM65_189 [Sphingomonas bacterium]|nr:hypothetical protein [Sphingomonas bacterium]
MKQVFPPHRRALAALVPTLALLAVPAVAQDQQTPVAPPPVVTTAPPAPAAPVQAAPAQTAPVQTVQAAPVEALPPPDVTPERAAPRATRAPAPTRTVTQRTTTTRTATAPVAAPPAATPAPAPAPVAATPETPPVVTPAPVEQAATSTTTQSTAPAPASTGFNWASPWLALIGVGLIALVGFIMMARRRRVDEYESYDEPVAYEEPVRAPAPIVPEPVIAAAPIARPDAQFLRREAPRATAAPLVADEQVAAPVVGTGELVESTDSDVEALTAGNPPVADRPWLEMAMRPVRAGTNVDEALVEIELTVGNSGSVAANDVRISTFMFANAPAADEMERLLVERDGEGVPSVRIKPGEGTTLEATLALPRSSLNGSVSPVIVADARYPLPGGGEGHTAASFRISVSDDGETMTPIPTDRAHMFDEVSAELEGVPQRA